MNECCTSRFYIELLKKEHSSARLARHSTLVHVEWIWLETMKKIQKNDGLQKLHDYKKFESEKVCWTVLSDFKVYPELIFCKEYQAKLLQAGCL